MQFIDIIRKKRLKKELSREEIEFAINGYLDNSIKDYQMSAFLMAISLNGMSNKETIDLTDIMIKSGNILNLSKIDEIIVDKHSTGGVGDKVTLILGPLLASLGIKVAKVCNKSVGYNLGTIDKLEAIEGFNTNMSESKFINQVNKINIAFMNQPDDLVPVDKKIYSLRTLTDTLDSIPLIASSIMSKKIASGADVILIDVKVGSGSLIKKMDDALKLADLMVKIGKSYRKLTICLITNMDEPLGYAVGPSLEVNEAINTLRGNGPSDLLEISITLASIIIGAVKKIQNDEAKDLLFRQLNNGEAYKKLKQLVKMQGGNLEKIKISDKVFSIKSDKSGYINKINALKLGIIAKQIGAIRNSLDDTIDYEVGILLSKKVGDYIEKDEEIAKVYLKDKDVSVNEILDCFEIEEQLIPKSKLIFNIIK